MPPETLKSLLDVLHHGLGIQQMVEGRSLDEFRSDRMLRLAVERSFEIIGEAVNRLRKADPDLAASISEYRDIISFRNVLIHGYDAIDDAITWRIIEKKLPVLIGAVRALMHDA
jgi:uncharacterized protein with HEPN domain